jgi:hypothetical protein
MGPSVGGVVRGNTSSGGFAVTGPQTNKGLIVQGGTVTTDVMAIGDGARAIKNVTAADQALDNKGWVELRQRLDELVAAVNTHAPALPDGRDVVTATEGIAGQLAEPQPNKFVLTTLLDGLASKVQSVTTLAVALEGLRAAIGVVL